MRQLPDIRQCFKPVQPSIKNPAGGVIYSEWLPDINLAKYIYCYWQLKTHKPLSEPFYYRVVADGCVDIFFDTHYPADNFVMGFSAAYTEFSLDNSFNYTGIRFLPAGFPLLFNVDASELTNRSELLRQVLPKVSGSLAEISVPDTSLEKLKPLLDRYFLRILADARLDIDMRLFGAVDRILKARGVLHVESDLDTGVSPRQLRRLFDFYIGSTPKTFSKVVRFQNLLHAKPSVQSLKENKLFYDTGYYDQAHFIKEFKNFYGQTPGQALGR